MKKLNWLPARLLVGLVCKNVIKMTEVISRAREMAMKRIAMEEECLRLAKEEERFRIEAVEKARKEFATEQRRQIDAEMAEARLRAQQAIAEAEAHSIKDAEEAEIAKEIARLKARTPVEVLQDELEQMRATMAEMAVGYKALLAEKRTVPQPVLIASPVKFQQKVPIAVYGGLLGYQGISNIIISQGTNRYSFGCVTTTFAGQAHIILVINLDTEMNLISANKISHCNTNKEEVDFTKEVALLCGVEPIASPRTFSISASNGSFGDPAVGHGKKLVINYRAMDTTGNLRDFEASAFEHDTCSFTVAGMSGFEIIKATWGNSHGCCGGSSNRCGRGGSISFSDVTGKVKSMCQ